MRNYLSNLLDESSSVYHPSITSFPLDYNEHDIVDVRAKSAIDYMVRYGLLDGKSVKYMYGPMVSDKQLSKSIPGRLLSYIKKNGTIVRKYPTDWTTNDKSRQFRFSVYELDGFRYVIQSITPRNSVNIYATESGMIRAMKEFRKYE